MRTEFLTNWEILAIEQALKYAHEHAPEFGNGEAHEHMQKLRDKVEAASHIRLTNRPKQSAAQVAAA